MADTLQSAIDVAIGTPGTMYAEYTNRIYDLDLFRSRTIEHLTAAGLCGAWDYGNVIGDEIFVRSADGCVVEQYDIITGEGGVRNANKGSNAWQEGWGVPVPGPQAALLAGGRPPVLAAGRPLDVLLLDQGDARRVRGGRLPAPGRR